MKDDFENVEIDNSDDFAEELTEPSVPSSDFNESGTSGIEESGSSFAGETNSDVSNVSDADIERLNDSKNKNYAKADSGKEAFDRKVNNKNYYKDELNNAKGRKETAKNNLKKASDNKDQTKDRLNQARQRRNSIPRGQRTSSDKEEYKNVKSEAKDAKAKGYNKGRFSFNVKGGRCEACWGDGVKKIEMHFLPDVYVPCEVCHGTRYNRETLEIKYKNKNINDVLNMTVEEALTFFENIPKIKNKLQVLMDVGLSYMKLGQPAPSLSGGEAARIKLAKELQKKPTGRSIFILDEPTTGLHIHDIKKLLEILNRIVDNGDTVIIIEHNMDVIKVCDYIIDLGPEGGNLGGNVVCTGTPEQISKVSTSYTGKYLKKYL